ncbi:insulinase family protein [uncultured Treponema sp.]|uniref:insulinase family protein n=1 Tax=Treponema sp. TaxID=166 RepID=UPI0025D345FB|nr:insulinase family protein [uncultured Treponema sp.]MEE0353124.1 insulinase family protein [Treponema sp.]
MAKKFFLCTAFSFCIAFGFSQAESAQENKLELSISTLQNGLTVFILPDETNALLNVELVVKAGFSSQTSSTAGFFPLYTRLFSKSGEAKEILKAFSIHSECNADSSIFKAKVPPENLKLYLEQIAQCASSPNFSDKDIEDELAQMKTESLAYSKSTTGFINSAIDSRIFYKEPWKHDSGIYPAIFSGYNTKQARAVLYNFVSKEFYTPYNSALFITGNIAEKKALEISQEAFKDWNSKTTDSSFKKFKTENLQQSKGKKFVLAAKEFSPELTQIVVQYTSLSQSQTDILSCVFNNEKSKYKTTLPQIPELNIRSADFITAASAIKNGNTRFILQALIEEPPKGKSIADQAQTFLAAATECTNLNEDEIKFAQNEIEKKYRELTGNPSNLSSKLAEFWAMNKFETPEIFYKEFEKSISQVENETSENISKAILNEEPYIFLLVNNSIYKKNKKSFDEYGYELITQENASWYTNELLAKSAKQEMQAALEKPKQSKNPTIEIRPADYFYFNSMESIKYQELKNGIPVSVKENPNSKTVAVCISISGGKFASPESETNLRSVLISAVAKNSKIENITNKTDETVSYISFEVFKEELENALKKISDALIYGTVSPVQADLLFREEGYEQRMKNADLGFQMKSSALAYLYRSSPLSKIFKAEEKERNSSSYQALLLEYTKLLDASLYSIAICGDIEFDKAIKYCQDTFEVLKEQSARKELEFPKPSFKNKERKVQLKHIYTTNLPAKLAPKDSPRLVPTKNFYDPAQIYFRAPDSTDEDLEIFNSLLYILCTEIQSILGNEISCKTEEASVKIPVGIIQANELKRTGIFFDAYKIAREKLIKELLEEETKNWTCEKIKIQWKQRNLFETQSNSGTAKLMASFQKKEQYLTNYLYIENSTPQDFLNAIEKYFPTEPLMKVYSADSKK